MIACGIEIDDDFDITVTAMEWGEQGEQVGGTLQLTFSVDDAGEFLSAFEDVYLACCANYVAVAWWLLSLAFLGIRARVEWSEE